MAYDSFDAAKLQGRLHYYGRMQGKDDIGARERREDALNSTAPCAPSKRSRFLIVTDEHIAEVEEQESTELDT